MARLLVKKSAAQKSTLTMTTTRSRLMFVGSAGNTTSWSTGTTSTTKTYDRPALAAAAAHDSGMGRPSGGGE